MNSRTYYSQHGEDCVLWELFQNQTTLGFFVEIGALDGTRFSNTYSFERAGWSGICVEAHPDYIELLRKNRPNSIIIHAAVSDQDKDSITFYANSRGSLSTLDPTLEDEFRKYGKYFTGWETKQVPMKTLNTIFDQANAPKWIDILSIDIEGTEMAALKGLDLNKYRPRVMLIESRDEPTELLMDSYLAAAGYIKARKISNNIFYCREQADVKIISTAPVDCALMHTPHPCDLKDIPDDISLQSFKVLSVNEIISQTPADFSEAASTTYIKDFISDPRNIFLISFPRTGSHWLRLIMELYFDRPTLTRIFYKHNNNDYMLLHNHDVELKVTRENVIYLYRDPVDTVYSQLNYYKEDINDKDRIEYWADLYGKHLSKWLFEERFTKTKLVLRYEELKNDPSEVIKKLADFYGVAFDEARADEVIAQVSKSSVRKKTERHDPQVQNVASDYEQRRKLFGENHSKQIWEITLRNRQYIQSVFENIYSKDSPRDLSDTAVHDISGQPAKIVGLIAARNEEKIIDQCLKAFSLYADAIVFLDDASDDRTVEIVEHLASQCRIERIIRKSEWYRDEPGDRNKLLQAGREIGGTHFIVLDADEMFTANCLENNCLRNTILSLKPGDILKLNWIQLWRSVNQYRFDNSVWTWNYKDFIFCDDGKASYSSDFIHTKRTPYNLQGNMHQIDGYIYGVMHFQFVNWRNLLIKQAWYRCLERIRNPQKPAYAINSLYAPSKNEQNLGLRPVPIEWFTGYTFIDKAVFDQPEEWREKQVLQWFKKYRKEFFRDLDIWDTDWGQGIPLYSVHKTRGKDKYVPNFKDSELQTVSSKKEIKVSAIVSTYNSERFMRGCLEDLINQTLYQKGELEIIVVDSGSQQNERTIVEEFQKQHSNIIYIRTEERETVYAAWNRGIKRARGKYITNANTDDRHRKDALEVMANILDQSDIGSVYADVIITETENEIFEHHTPVAAYRWLDYSREQLAISCFIGPQPMWRKSLHDKYGYFDETFFSSGDWEFWLRIAEDTKFLHIHEFLGLYLRSPQSIEHKNAEQRMKEDRIIYKAYIPKYFPEYEEYFTKLIGTEFSDPIHVYRYGQILAAFEKYDKAIGLYTSYLQKNPNNKEFIPILNDIKNLKAQHLSTQTSTDSEHLEQIHPFELKHPVISEKVIAYINQADVHIANNNLASARESIRQALNYATGNDRLISILSNILNNLGDPESASKLLKDNEKV